MGANKDFGDTLDLGLDDETPVVLTGQKPPKNLKEHQKAVKKAGKAKTKAATFKVEEGALASLKTYVHLEAAAGKSVTQGEIVTAGINWYLRKYGNK